MPDPTADSSILQVPLQCRPSNRCLVRCESVLVAAMQQLNLYGQWEERRLQYYSVRELAGAHHRRMNGSANLAPRYLCLEEAKEGDFGLRFGCLPL